MAVNQEILSNKPTKEESVQLQNARANLDILVGAYQEYSSLYKKSILPSTRETSRYLSEEEIEQLYQDTQARIENTTDKAEQEIIRTSFNSIIHDIEQDPERIFVSHHTLDGGYFQFYLPENGVIRIIQQPDKSIGFINK